MTEWIVRIHQGSREGKWLVDRQQRKRRVVTAEKAQNEANGNLTASLGPQRVNIDA